MAFARHVSQVVRSNAFACVRKPGCIGVLNTKRTLFSHEFMKLDEYAKHRSVTQARLGDLSAKFKQRMDEYMASSSTNAIFTDDLRTMLHIASSDEDLNTAVNMLKRYASQNTSSSLVHFTFGPVVMRLLYSLGKPQLALELYLSPELKSVFNRQATSITVLMDLLFERGLYAEALRAYDAAGVGKPSGVDYLPNIVTLAVASCYKLNNPDSLEKMKDIVRGNKMAGRDLSNRSSGLAASLALNQNDPHTALEIMQLVPTKRFTTQNLKARAFTLLNRLEDALPTISYLVDLGKARGYKSLFPDTLARLGVAVETKGTASDKEMFATLKAAADEFKLVRTDSMESFLLSEINPTPRAAYAVGDDGSRRQTEQRGDRRRDRQPRFNRDEEALDEEPVKGLAR